MIEEFYRTFTAVQIGRFLRFLSIRLIDYELTSFQRAEELHYLWRAVDHEGKILESFVTKKRDKSAALEFMKRTLKRHGKAEAIVTDGLKSYPAAMRKLGNLHRREMGRWLNNRVDNLHLPIRRRERVMLRFRRMKTLQKFSSVHAQVHNHFNQERHLVSRQEYKRRRSAAFAEWQQLVA